MIDLHSHLLPGVDDGVRTAERAAQVLQRMVEDGLTAICFTPHLNASQLSESPPPAHDEAFAALSAVLPRGLAVHRGAEVLLDRGLPARAASTRRITLGGSRYILVEFTRQVVPTSVLAALKQVLDLGLVPLVAHPERYPACGLSSMAQWRSLGALIQVDANTLFHPTARGRRAREIVAEGQADVLAADNHGDDRSLAEPYRRFVKGGGDATAALLMRDNPAAILADRSTTVVDPFTVRIPLWSRVRGWIDEVGP